MARDEIGQSFGPGVGRFRMPRRTFGFNFVGTGASCGFQVNCFRKLNLAAGFAVEGRGMKGQARGPMASIKGLVV